MIVDLPDGLRAAVLVALTRERATGSDARTAREMVVERYGLRVVDVRAIERDAKRARAADS